jgi:GAF domain-containing protein
MATNYPLLISQVQSLIQDERDVVANMANISALIFHSLEDLNWAGFYRNIDGELVLGPFQGQTACIRIAFGKGVCDTAAATREVQVITDVHQFEGHIACDAASNSEIVLPIIHDGEIFGVLDIDSPTLNRFDRTDAKGLQGIVDVFVKSL